MALVVKMGANASIATDTSGTRSSQRIKTDAMSVDSKGRKQERIEGQVINQDLVKLQEEVKISKGSKD